MFIAILYYYNQYLFYIYNLLLPLSYNRCYIYIHISSSKCNNYNGTEVGLFRYVIDLGLILILLVFLLILLYFFLTFLYFYYLYLQDNFLKLLSTCYYVIKIIIFYVYHSLFYIFVNLKHCQIYVFIHHFFIVYYSMLFSFY